MVIDTSAVIAILLDEPERPDFIRAIDLDPKRLISVVSALEASVVIATKKGELGRRDLDLLLHEAGIDVVAMDVRQLELAREAAHRFGKGRHPAALNIGDCCAYALAMASGEPLLFKGADFARTDVRAVVAAL